MPGIARLNAGVVRIGRQLAKRRNIMWRLEFDLSLEQDSPDQPEKRVQNGRSATRLNVASRFELPLLGSNQDSPDPEPSRAGLFGGHHVRKWLPAKHRRPQARGAMPGLARRNACKTLARVLLDSPDASSGECPALQRRPASCKRSSMNVKGRAHEYHGVR